MKVQRFEKLIWLLACRNEFLIAFEMRFWAHPIMSIKCSFQFEGDKTSLRCEFEEDLNFRSFLAFRNMRLMFDCFQLCFWARPDVCCNCSLEFTHWNYFLFHPRNLLSLTLVFIVNVNLVECQMCKITFSI